MQLLRMRRHETFVPAVLFETVSEKIKREKIRMRKLITICLVAGMLLALSSTSEATIVGTFDSSGIGSTYLTFASLAAAHDAFMGTPEDSITFSEFAVPTTVTTQYSASKGVTFSNVGGTLSTVMYEGNTAAGGYILDPLDGYDGTYMPDSDKAYCRFPNTDAGSPYTITFATSMATVGSFIGMGVIDPAERTVKGPVKTLTVKAYDASNVLLATLSVNTDQWVQLYNREGFWGIHSDTANIKTITILNDYPVNYLNAMEFDNLEWSSTPVPEPATVALLGLGALSLIRRKRSA
jgi:hypothetical protein